MIHSPHQGLGSAPPVPTWSTYQSQDGSNYVQWILCAELRVITVSCEKAEQVSSLGSDTASFHSRYHPGVDSTAWHQSLLLSDWLGRQPSGPRRCFEQFSTHILLPVHATQTQTIIMARPCSGKLAEDWPHLSTTLVAKTMRSKWLRAPSGSVQAARKKLEWTSKTWELREFV